MVLSPVMEKCMFMLIGTAATCVAALIHHMFVKLK